MIFFFHPPNATRCETADFFQTEAQCGDKQEPEHCDVTNKNPILKPWLFYLSEETAAEMWEKSIHFLHRGARTSVSLGNALPHSRQRKWGGFSFPECGCNKETQSNWLGRSIQTRSLIWAYVSTLPHAANFWPRSRSWAGKVVYSYCITQWRSQELHQRPKKRSALTS